MKAIGPNVGAALPLQNKGNEGQAVTVISLGFRFEGNLHFKQCSHMHLENFNPCNTVKSKDTMITGQTDQEQTPPLSLMSLEAWGNFLPSVCFGFPIFKNEAISTPSGFM